MHKSCKKGFDAYAILKIAHEYKNWKLSVYNPQIIQSEEYKN